jgi:SAM-dependent methyltransferase
LIEPSSNGSDLSLIYRAFYRLGLTPWEQDEPEEALAALVTGPAALTPGRALDVGCGTGTDAIFCARNGWQVTGIDDVPLALKRARVKAMAAGVEVRFVQADVTRAGPERVGAGYQLLIDMGCLHNLDQRVRPATTSR